MHELAQALVNLIFDWGYLGIYLLMSIESSFIPFPSEIVLVPAGYLASKGEMSMPIIMFVSLLGSMTGAFINYFLAYFVGRAFLLRYGKYFFISEKALLKMEDFFEKHGAISTFTGRLIPGIRQLISIPAGLSKMNLMTFSTYTALGAGIWGVILTLLGYFIGENEELLKEYLHHITLTTLFLIVIILVTYIVIKRKQVETNS